MIMPQHKTKIICTIGPATKSPETIEALIRNGMSIARLNLSHGEYSEHKRDIITIRQVAAKLNKPIGIIIDLPGVKMRIGKLKEQSFILKNGDQIALTTKAVLGTPSLVSVNYKRLPESVSKGSIIFLNDGFIQLKVERIKGSEIFCKVVIGGKLLSHKGLNVPGAKLFIDPITQHDLDIIDFGLKQGVNTFGLSFIENASDLRRVRAFAKNRGKSVYLVSKIERKTAIDNIDEILKETDAVMIARGDLGIEIPIEQVPIVQKELILKANIIGCPVITATQMLGSMTQNVRPTRAEVNDVANAVLDGTDAIMLSEETAIGEYPIDTVKMMSQIACSAEKLYHQEQMSKDIHKYVKDKSEINDYIITNTVTLNVVETVKKLGVKYIITQTSAGGTARHISRFKPNCWILAFSEHASICEFLAYSYGVYPILIKNRIKPDEILNKFKRLGMVKKDDIVIITERRFSSKAGDTDSLGIIKI